MPRPRRPVLRASVPDGDPADHVADLHRGADLAAATAAAVLAAGRDGLRSGSTETASLVGLADTVGLETLAELWRTADPDSLAGSLWALYLLRAWCRSSGPEVLRLWQAGRASAPADEVVAGVSDHRASTDPAAVEELADAVLGGAYGGEFDVALDRAAAFFRIVALGRRSLAAAGADTGTELGVENTHPDVSQLELAERNERVARGLTKAAQRWRAGTLH